MSPVYLLQLEKIEFDLIVAYAEYLTKIETDYMLCSLPD